MKRYWVQSDFEGAREFRIHLKTNALSDAILRMKRSSKEVFIWDCLNRTVVDANYDCRVNEGD